MIDLITTEWLRDGRVVQKSLKAIKMTNISVEETAEKCAFHRGNQKIQTSVDERLLLGKTSRYEMEQISLHLLRKMKKSGKPPRVIILLSCYDKRMGS